MRLHRIAALIFISVLPLAAQPLISGLTLVQNEECTTFEFQTSVPGNGTQAWLEYYADGETAWEWKTRKKFTVSASATVRVDGMCNARGKTFFRAVADSGSPSFTESAIPSCPSNCGDSDGDASDAGDECTNAEYSLVANPADLEHSIFCGGSGQRPYFIAPTLSTDPDSRPDPILPTHTLDPEVEPTIEASDSFTATNFQAKLTSIVGSKNANPSNDYLLTGPCGATIRPQDESSPLDNWTLPTSATANWLVIKPDCDAKLLPPLGIPYTPEFKFHTLNFEQNVQDAFAYAGHFNVRSLFAESATEGVRMEGVRVTTPAALAPILRVPIASYSGGTITTSSPHTAMRLQAGTSPRQFVWVDTPGVTGLPGICFVATLPSSTQLTCDSKTGSGTYSGGGEVVQAFGVGITSCNGDASTPTCTLAEDFPFFHASVGTISSIAAPNKITTTQTPTQLNLTVNTTIRIFGSPSQDGYYVISAISGSELTLSGASFAVCSSSCGSATMARVVIIRGNSNPLLNRTVYVEGAADSDTVTLKYPGGLNAGGVTGTGGIMLARMSNAGRLLGAPSVSERFVFRGLIETKFPFKSSYIYGFTNHSAVIDSWIECATGHLVDPVSNRNIELNWNTCQGIYGSGLVDDMRAARTTVISDGWGFFKDTFRNMTNLSIGPFVSFTPNRFMTGLPNSDGLSYGHQNNIELKGCEFCLFNGIHIRGSNPNRASSGVGLLVLGVSSTSGYSSANHLTFKNLVFYDGGTPMQVSYHGINDGAVKAEELYTLPARIKIDNVVAVVDYMKYQALPTELGGPTTKYTSWGGQFLYLAPGAGTLKMDRIAFIPKSAPSNALIAVSLGAPSHSTPSQGLSIRDTFFVSQDGNSGNGATGGFHSNAGAASYTAPAAYVPAQTGANLLKLFTDTVGNGPTLSNLFISGGTARALFGDTEDRIRSLLDSISVLRDELASRAALAGLTFTPIGGVGSGDSIDSYAMRLDSVFEEGTWIPKAASPLSTVNIDEIKKAMLEIREPSLTRVSDTSAQVTFKAPSATQDCKWQVTTRANGYMSGADPAEINAWTAVAEGSESRSFTITDLTPGTIYDVRLSCGAALKHKEFIPGS